MVLVVLILDTAIEGAGRFDQDLLFDYDSIVRPETTGFRAGILGSLWLMLFTALHGGASRYRGRALPGGVRQQGDAGTTG